MFYIMSWNFGVTKHQGNIILHTPAYNLIQHLKFCYVNLIYIGAFRQITQRIHETYTIHSVYCLKINFFLGHIIGSQAAGVHIIYINVCPVIVDLTSVFHNDSAEHRKFFIIYRF